VHHDKHTYLLTYMTKVNIHSVNNFSFVQCSRKISFVSKHKHRDSVELRLVQQVVEFVLRSFHLVLIRRVYHVTTNTEPSIPTPVTASFKALLCSVTAGKLLLPTTDKSRLGSGDMVSSAPAQLPVNLELYATTLDRHVSVTVQF